ncbi:UNVERIFIED_ORG: NAD-dependent epimerase/dehydratase family protein [Bacillus sp. AZ43]
MVLTGASGFIGSHVRRLLEGPGSGCRLRVLARTPDPTWAAETHQGDLRDGRSLRGLATGASALVHCASYVGRSAELAERTNVAGTRALLDEAARSDVGRVVHVSTAAVYGRGPFRNRAHETLPVAPASPLSRTRADAEAQVLEAGGVVLRPHLVYGTGDRWVGPSAVRLATLLQGRVAGLDALVSMVDVRRLADAVVRCALAAEPDRVARLYDCNHPVPVPVADCLRGFMAAAGIPVHPQAIGYGEAYRALRERGEPTHDLDMLSADHWFDSARLWAELDLDAGPPFLEAVRDHSAWYAASA